MLPVFCAYIFYCPGRRLSVQHRCVTPLYHIPVWIFLLCYVEDARYALLVIVLFTLAGSHPAPLLCVCEDGPGGRHTNNPQGIVEPLQHEA